MIQAPADGGMGIAAGNINIAFFIVILAAVAYLTFTKIAVTEKLEVV